MKPFLRILLVLMVIALGVVVFKVVQKQCWDRKISLFSPPSLDSLDPLERIEAAHQAARKFGGKS